MLEVIEKELASGGKHILEILLRSKAISAQQFSEVLTATEKEKKPAIDILIQKNLVSSEGIAQAYAELFKIPYIDLRKQKISSEGIFTLPEDAISKNKIAVFDISKNSYRVAIADPFDKTAWDILENLDKKDEKDIDLYLTSKDGIDHALRFYQTASKKPEAEAEKIFKPQVSTPSPFEGPAAIPTKVPVTPAQPGAPSPESKIEVEVIEAVKPAQGTPIIPSIGPAMPGAQALGPSAAAQPAVAIPGAISQAPEKANMPALAEMDISQLADEKINSVDDLKRVIAGATIPKIVGAVIRTAITMRASDVHIEPQESQLRIRYRIDGILNDIVYLPKELLPAIVARIKILAKLKIDETRVPQDGSFRITFEGRLVDLRISTFPTILAGEKVVIRILDKGTAILTLEGVGLRGENLRRVNKAIDKPHGIVLVTGPTGSGKSTTLYAMLDKLNSPKVNLITIEDPVEYTISGITQAQVNPKIGLTFAEGFRSILRQDPNIIMVGEIRDAETAELAVQAALTGHLILTTLHTNDAPSALPRLIEMGIEPFLITSSMNAILAQRLVRRICPDCKKEIKLPPAVLEDIKKEIETIASGEAKSYKIDETIKFYKGSGCATCGQTGYKGRLGIFEVLEMTSEIEHLAVTHEPASKIREAAIRTGMVTVRQDGAMKVLDGITTWDEILRVTSV